MNKKLAIEKFNKIRDIFYRIPLNVNEIDYCCSGKHVLLKKELDNLGYKTRYRVVAFEWCDLDLPTKVVKIPHENYSTHVYLEVKIEDKWKIVDATWDKGLKNVFRINEWDGISSTELALPITEIFSIEESENIMVSTDNDLIEADLKKNGEFYKVFNEWLESVRI